MVSFIIEGTEQQGKTTLAQKLVKEFGYSYKHFGVPVEGFDPIKEYTSFIDGTNRIIDRGYLSEIVYGNLFRGKSSIDTIIQEKIESTLQENNYILLLCNRNKFTDNDILDRDEAYGLDKIIKIKDEFLKEYKKVSCPKIIIDPFDDKQVKRLFKEIRGGNL